MSAYHLLVAFLILFLCLPFVASLPLLTRNSLMGGGGGLWFGTEGCPIIMRLLV